MIETKIFPNTKIIDKYILDLWKKIMQNSINKRGVFNVALSGGNTPLSLYSLLGVQKSWNWAHVHFFIVDERFVPIGHADHNYSKIKNRLLDPLKILETHRHPINTNVDTVEDAETLYITELVRHFGDKNFPTFDLILLGLGGDGHTASLFPDTPSLDVQDKYVTHSHPISAPYDRITLSYPTINHARNIIFQVTGSDKAKVLKAVIKNQDPLYPSSAIAPKAGTLIFVLDEKAGSLLK